ncbi:MAG: flavin reductase family protein [Bacteroidales bacterium]|jgi:flavin reductase (DIM6/NTAB) family NADH-FMN oxidoreductase RutF|nr:flavin reductase family protein [Bacteroidales bacterium]
MSKIPFKAGTMLYPLPAVMVSCGQTIDEYNIITVAWVGTLASEPPMCYVSIRKSRHSHKIISQSKCFVINLTTESLARETDWCGVKSGRQHNKFVEMNLTPVKAPHIQAPMIDESPLCIECEVVEVKELGSHDCFIARVVGINAEERYIDAKTGEFDLEKAGLLAYAHGKYYSLGSKLGFFGFSVQKKTAKRQNKKKN